MIAASHQPHHLLRLNLLMAVNSPIQEVATKLSRTNRQSSRAIYAIRPEVAPEPEGHECHSQGDQANREDPSRLASLTPPLPTPLRLSNSATDTSIDGGSSRCWCLHFVQVTASVILNTAC